ncbi:MAG TPA: BTAD domain-containing putative transcriptional regulator [Longimicrobiales bacterium]
MFRLGLLGSPCIVDAEDNLLAGRASQRHRLALLSLLALSPARAASRDKLLAYLWPERDASHGRNLLRQSVHVVRKALGDAVILTSGDDLRLNTTLLRVDVLEFEAAIARSDHRDAIALYRGPFLDGFFLEDAPEFEHWAERERRRLEQTFGSTLEELASAAEAEHDFARAVEHWRMRAAHDPYDARVAQRLMRALEADGNPIAALQHATLYARLLEEEFGAAPPSEVLELAERIRAHPAVTSRAASEEYSPDNVSGSRDRGAIVGGSADTLPPTPALRARIRPRWAVPGAAAILVLAILIRMLWPGGDHAGTAGIGAWEPSIAVLPLGSPGNDSLDAALAQSMTEELIAMLARTGGLRVLASTSTTGFRDRQVDARAIADSLSVSYLLEGSVQKTDSRLRVHIRLVDGRDGSTRWSEEYRRAFDDVFSVQDEIARAVAGELGLRFDRERQLLRHRTRNVAAYEFYVRGWDPVLLRSQSGVWRATEYFQQAIAADSTYAAAHAGLALMYIRRARTTGDPLTPPAELIALAEDAALSAVELDESLAEAHYALAQVRETMLDFPAAERAIRRAIELDPTRSVYRRRLAYLHGWAGRAEDELMEARRALDTDPLNPYAHVALAGALFGTHRYDEALAQLERVAAFQPPLQAYDFIAAQIHAKQQRWPEAIAALRPQAEAGDPLFVALLGYVLARAGQRDEASRILSDLLERQESAGFRSFQVAVVYAGLGDRDQAFVWLDRSIDDHSISSLIMGPTFDHLHDDPRFQRLKARLGLANPSP